MPALGGGRYRRCYISGMYTITLYLTPSTEKQYVTDAWGYPSPGVIAFREKTNNGEVCTNCRFLIEKNKMESAT